MARAYAHMLSSVCRGVFMRTLFGGSPQQEYVIPDVSPDSDISSWDQEMTQRIEDADKGERIPKVVTPARKPTRGRLTEIFDEL